jgi:hypothetical protein
VAYTGPDTKGRRNMATLGYRRDMEFPEFVRHCRSVRDEDLHTRPQVDFLPARMDFLRRYEGLPAGWAYLQSRFSLPDLPVLNTTSHSQWQSYYDAGLQQLAESMYSQDLALWESL